MGKTLSVNGEAVLMLLGDCGCPIPTRLGLTVEPELIDGEQDDQDRQDPRNRLVQHDGSFPKSRPYSSARGAA